MVLAPSLQSSILTCAKYAYRPNRLGYCGPDQNRELLQYIESGLPSEALAKDGGLIENLEKFETLFPYLRHIAHTNKEKNLFDEKIVRAYWVGNSFLERSGGAKLFYHLTDDLKLKKKLPKKAIEELSGKIPRRANAHHSFHVFNIWKRTGHTENPHTLYTMDECRIGWGKVQNISKEIAEVLYRPLVFKEGQLAFGEITSKKIFCEFGEACLGDWISFHWSSFCEVLGENEIAQLKYWTKLNLDLANYER